MAAEVDPTFCPLCGQPNRCAATEAACAAASGDCWCSKVEIDSSLLRRVPAPAQGRACLCAACAASPKRPACDLD